MKVSLSWLRQYVSMDMSLDRLVDALTMAGLEVDTVTDRYGYLDGVRVGRVLDVSPHPNADRLSVCRVDTSDGVWTVVCGAPNVRPGQMVPLALAGTVLPDGTVLEKTAIRGVTSGGMICSRLELGLGLGLEGSGIMVLDPGLTPGSKLSEALDLDDWVLDIDLTPNRPDCLSLIGVAREIAAIGKTTLMPPDFSLADAGDRIHEAASVTILAPDHCPRYSARLVTGISVGPSPLWLQDRLMSVGLRPINNIVDITNFVLMETGQPLHAFDFDRLEEHRIVVRTAAEGETFTTLDGKERRLTVETLMICDGVKPVAVAGVMGGLNSEIEDTTTQVLIESAYFNPVSIRKTAKHLGLNTEASHRFERGVDPNGTVNAVNRAAVLMAELGGGHIVPGLIDAHPGPVRQKTVTLDVPAANRLLGTDLTPGQMRGILESIAFEVDTAAVDTLAVRPPSFRVDVERPEDLMEEIARLWGYDRIPTTFPLMPARTRQGSRMLRAREDARRLMTGFGFTEAINYSFVSPRAIQQLGLDPEDPRCRTIAILNPLSEEQAVMRTSLVPSLLNTMSHNLAQQIRDLRVFETGRTYTADGDRSPAVETEMLAALWTGSRTTAAWHTGGSACDYYDMKGVFEGLLEGLGVGDCTFTALPVSDCCYTRPGHSARVSVGGIPVGLVGEVHPRLVRDSGVKQAAYILEMDMGQLVSLLPEEKRSVPLPKFPAVHRDVTLILAREVEAGRVLEGVAAQGEPLVESCRLFDVYEGEPIPAGKKSVSFRITYRSQTETLEDAAVNALHETVTRRLVKAFDAGLPA